MTKIFRVGRSYIDVHTYKSLQNLKYGDGRDLYLWFGRDFFIFYVIPKEMLNLKMSLMISSMIINQQYSYKSKKIYV